MYSVRHTSGPERLQSWNKKVPISVHSLFLQDFWFFFCVESWKVEYPMFMIASPLMVIAYKTRIDDEVLEGAEGILDNLLSLCSTQTRQRERRLFEYWLEYSYKPEQQKIKPYYEYLVISRIKKDVSQISGVLSSQHCLSGKCGSECKHIKIIRNRFFVNL